jgi:hypothetical protein
MGNFTGNKLIIQRENHLQKYERRILNKVYIYTTGKLFQSELENWFEEIKIELIKKKYMKKYLIFGYRFTKLFKNDIKLFMKNGFDLDIIEFIHSQKLECLKPIINNIENINIPELDKDFRNLSYTNFCKDFIEQNNKNMSIRGNTLYLKKFKG